MHWSVIAIACTKRKFAIIAKLRFVQAVAMTDQCYKPHRQITCTTTASAKMYFAAQRDYMPFGVALSEERRNCGALLRDPVH